MLATVASSNSAQRLKHHLAETEKIETKIIQTPSALAKEGCGYSLRFDKIHKPLVINAGKILRINIRAFYREEKANGKPIFVKE